MDLPVKMLYYSSKNKVGKAFPVPVVIDKL